MCDCFFSAHATIMMIKMLHNHTSTSRCQSATSQISIGSTHANNAHSSALVRSIDTKTRVKSFEIYGLCYMKASQNIVSCNRTSLINLCYIILFLTDAFILTSISLEIVLFIRLIASRLLGACISLDITLTQSHTETLFVVSLKEQRFIDIFPTTGKIRQLYSTDRLLLIKRVSHS